MTGVQTCALPIYQLNTTSPSDVQDTSVCEEVKGLLDEKVFSWWKIILKGFSRLGRKGEVPNDNS